MSKSSCRFVVTKKDDCCYKTTTETVVGLYGVAVPAFPTSSTKDSVHVVRFDDALVTYAYNGTAWIETTNTPITSSVTPGVLVDNGDGTYTWTDTATTFVIDTTDRVLSTVVYSPATQDFTFTWSNGDTTVVDLTGLLNVYSLLDGNNTVVTGNGISTPWEVNGYGVVDNSDGTFTVTLPDGVTTFLIDTNDVVTSITNTVTGNKIADYTNELGIVTPINETITSIVNNGDGTATFTNESGVATTFPIGAVTVVNNGDGTYTITLADGSTVTISDTSTSTLVDNLDGTYTYTDETGAVTTFNTNDTITTLVDNGDGTLTYTSEDGTVTTFNKGFTSVTNNADGTWTYTYPNLSTTNLDICALLAASSCLPTLTDNGDGTYTFNDGQGNTTTFNGGWTTFANSTNGFTATYPDGSTYVWAETITSLVAATNGWEYTSEDGTTTTVTYLFDNSTPASPNLLVQVNGTTQASIPLNSYDVNITTSGGFTFNPTTDEITITETDGETHVIDLTPLRTTLTSVDGSVEIVPSVNPDGSTNYDLGVKVHTNQVETVPYTGTELPVIAGVTVGDTKTVQFSDGTVVDYTFDGTDWMLDFATSPTSTTPATLTTVTGGTGLPNTATFDNGIDPPTVFNYIEGARHDLRLTSPIIERGSDSATDPKGAQFLHNGHSHLNGFYDSWIGNTNNMIYQITPVRDAQNVVTFTRFGDAQINDVYVGRGIGDVSTNTVVGALGLRNNSSGANNTAIGFGSLYLNNTGYSNTAVGVESQAYSTTARENSSLGHQALASTNGNGNVAIGFNAHRFGGTSGGCISIGSYALWQNTGENNIGIGASALFNTSMEGNIGIGPRTQSAIGNVGYQNVSVGVSSLQRNTVGYQNVALGTSAMENNLSGYLNTSVGHGSMIYNTTGARNTAVGAESLFENTTGEGNTAVGRESSRLNTTGFLNTSVGYGSNQSNNGSENVILGQGTMINATLANNNTAAGKSSMALNLTGNNNATLGRNSLFNTKVSNYNTAIGTEAAEVLISPRNATILTPGNSYTITSIGTTDFTLIGAASNTVGLTFTATGPGTGTGQAYSNMPSDFNTVVGAQSGSTFYEGQNNTIVGARIQGDYYMNNTVLLGDGAGNVRYKSDANGANFLNGSVKISDSATAPTPGTIRYNAAADKFQGFTSGSGWVDLH